MGDINKRGFYSVQEDDAVFPMKNGKNFFLCSEAKAPNLPTDFGQIFLAFPDYLPDLPPIPPEEQVLSKESDISLTDVSSLADEDNDFSTILDDFPEVSSKVSSLVADDASNEDQQTSLHLNPQLNSTPAKQALIQNTDSGFHNESSQLISNQDNNPPSDFSSTISDSDFLKISDLEWLHRLLN